ncbi:MAG: 4Fe-4S dicluster domain-containing protein [Coriobacteriia bacterium]|nr:4Fe-4S dicluster domain-containing protein [Coriobacteriia bacterium]
MRAALRSLAYLLPQVLNAVWRGPQTVAYPFQPAEIPEGYRGVVRIRGDLCRGCGLCVRDCPAFALELERGPTRDQYRLLYYPHRCAYCGQCELSCTFGALYHDTTFVGGVETLDDLVTVLKSTVDGACP